MADRFEVRRLTAELLPRFFRFMENGDEGRGFCFCTAWWVPTWEEWPDRTAEENRAFRETLFARGEMDGYLLFDGAKPVGWCQAGPRDRLEKLRRQYGLAPDPATWAVTCFEIAPSRRGRGAARFLLRGVLEDLRRRGVGRVEGFPKCGAGPEPGQVWTGPEGLFRGEGFEPAGSSGRGPVYAKSLR